MGRTPLPPTTFFKCAVRRFNVSRCPNASCAAGIGA
jgi:hypothetical protein